MSIITAGIDLANNIFAAHGVDRNDGKSQELPVWSRHIGDPVLASNMTRRVGFARFMVAALENDEPIHEAPAIVGCRTM